MKRADCSAFGQSVVRGFRVTQNSLAVDLKKRVEPRMHARDPSKMRLT
jgi:hypothetical protein